MVKKIEEVLEFNTVKQIISGYAVSEGGKELCRSLEWFTDKNRIMQLLDELDNMIEFLNKIPDFSVSDLTNVSGILQKIVPENSFIFPDEIISIYKNLRISRDVKQKLSKHINELESLKDYYLKLLNHKDLEDSIEKVIDIDEITVKDSASPALSEIRREIGDVQRKVKREIARIVDNEDYKNLLMEDYFTIKDNRFVLPLRIEYKNKIKGIIHGFSSSKQTVYIEPDNIVELDNRIVELREKEEQEIIKILTILSSKINAHRDEIKSNYQILIYLDFLSAKSRYSMNRKLTRARWSESELKIIDGRHPLLIEQKDLEVVPISVRNGSGFRILVITGPNTGGKTISLKTIGLISMLFQSGMHVPAEIGTQLPIFTKIFADIGDEQSLQQSLSTFSGHLQNIKNALDRCDKESLVLLDELGAGTDPSEGGAISCGILEYLEKKWSTVFATTHLNSIKVFAHNSKACMNASMEFDSNSLAPTYRIIMGVPGSSYALSIAEKLQIPGEVINSAKNYLSDSYLKLDQLLKDIQNSSLSIEEDKKLTKLEKMKASDLKEKYEKKLEELILKEKKIYEETVAKSEKILSQFRKDFEKTVKEIREKNASKESIKEAKEILNKHKENIKIEKEVFIEEKIPEPVLKLDPKKFQEGGWVKIEGFNEWAKITEIDFSKETLKVQIGNISILEKFKQVSNYKEKLPDNETEDTDYRVTKSREMQTNKLEVFGMLVEDAILELDIFINDAFLSNLSEIYIVHGLGSGRLRSGVREYLKGNPLVKSFRDASYSMGGAGTTVVTFDK